MAGGQRGSLFCYAQLTADGAADLWKKYMQLTEVKPRFDTEDNWPFARSSQLNDAFKATCGAFSVMACW